MDNISPLPAAWKDRRTTGFTLVPRDGLPSRAFSRSRSRSNCGGPKDGNQVLLKMEEWEVHVPTASGPRLGNSDLSGTESVRCSLLGLDQGYRHEEMACRGWCSDAAWWQNRVRYSLVQSGPTQCSDLAAIPRGLSLRGVQGLAATSEVPDRLRRRGADH